MTEIPRRRVTDRTTASPTFIGQGSIMAGDLQCQGDVVVAGQVTGDCIAQGSFTLTEGARWEGRLQASNAIIAGEVIGGLMIGEKIEIRKTARIRGSVSARSIAVAQGALIEGDLAVTSGASVVRYEEKRKEGE
jgi:cytoskeletal protein CcmA (bactofilin family)